MRPSGGAALCLADGRSFPADFRVRDPPFPDGGVMTEASPKKPRKKAALKTEAPEAETQTPPRDDQQMREAVLAAALPHAAFDGFTDSVLQNAGVEAGVAKPE